jgi:hypothetical protein
MYILYPIQKSRKRISPYHFFWAGYVKGYDILILGISKFYILYPLALQNAFFLLNTEINCEFPLN